MIVGFVYFKEVELKMSAPDGEIGKFVTAKTRAVEGEAKRNLSNRMVRVRTGRLRSSTGSQVKGTGKGTVGTVYSTAEYAKHVHAKRPYLTAALTTVAKTIR